MATSALPGPQIAIENLWPVTVDQYDESLVYPGFELPPGAMLMRHSASDIEHGKVTLEGGQLRWLAQAALNGGLKADADYGPALLAQKSVVESLPDEKLSEAAAALLEAIRIKRNMAYNPHLAQLNRYLGKLSEQRTSVFISIGSNVSRSYHLAQIDRIAAHRTHRLWDGDRTAEAIVVDRHGNRGRRPYGNTRKELHILRLSKLKGRA